MKIILANKFYYPRGGDCIYTIELEKLLKKNGNEVVIFTQQFEKNIKTNYSVYWPSKVDYSTKSLNHFVESFIRPIFSKEVTDKFKKLINDFKPDLIHLNNIHSQLSPVIAEIAYKKKIPVVWTLHDYKLLCPAYSCLRKGKVCELCFKEKINVVKHRCVKNFIGSTIAYLEAKMWNRKKLQTYTSLFIAPSKFMKEKMVQGGYSSDKIHILNNFINDKKIEKKMSGKEDYYSYFGRISNEKGVETLLKAASELPYTLKLIGAGPLFNKFKKKYAKKNIVFLGFKNWDELKEIIQKSQFSVIPSECYENNPLAIIEAFALGTPVIGANIGGIPELIEENKTGLLFESANVTDLKNKIEYFYTNLRYLNLGKNTIDIANNRFKSSQYYYNLLNIYNKISRPPQSNIIRTIKMEK